MSNINGFGSSHTWGRQSGKINFIGLFLLVGLAAGGYLLYMFLPHYINDYEFKRLLGIQVRNANDWTAETMKKNIMDFVKEKKIPLRDQDLQVFKDDREVSITVNYQVLIPLPMNNDRIVRFTHHFQEALKKH